MSNDDLYTASVQLQEYIESVRWQTAKDKTHQYTVVHWAPEKEKQFRGLVATIYEKGYKEKFWNAVYTYYQIGEYVYWSMNYRVEATILINRRAAKS